MSGHTPGPWWVTDSGVRDSGGLICSSIKAFHYPGQDARFEIEVAERSANARLIAAAPELLEALKYLADLYDTDEGCRSLPEYIAARAAIDKATGRKP